MKKIEKVRKSHGLLASCIVVFTILLTSAAARAQQSTGTPCSPAATETLDSKHLPTPPGAFQGEINLNAADSKPCWPARVVPPKDAPNVLLIMTDDGPGRTDGIALYSVPFHCALLTNPGSAHRGSFFMHNFWAIQEPQAKMMEMVNFMKNMGLLGLVLMTIAIPRPWPMSLGHW
jgi:hypothetical protein